MRTASCTNLAVYGDPSSFPRCMMFPWEVSSRLLVVSNLNLCHSPVRPLSLVWVYPVEQEPEVI